MGNCVQNEERGNFEAIEISSIRKRQTYQMPEVGDEMFHQREMLP